MKGFLFLVVLLLSFFASAAQEKLLVAAASDLKFALDSIIAIYRIDHKATIDVSYGASGKLTEQIINGAPFDVFLSADMAFPERLKKEGKTSSDIFPYAKGRIVLWSKKADVTRLQMKMLLDPTIHKIAIANPQHAPYGKRAKEALEHLYLWKKTESKIVYGENISQTAQFVLTGNADAGIVALSFMLSPEVKKNHPQYYLIPENTHQPLIQGSVITASGAKNDLSKSFFEFLKSDSAGAILNHFGFSRP